MSPTCRQLHIYGFRKLSDDGSGQHEFKHPAFVRGAAPAELAAALRRNSTKPDTSGVPPASIVAGRLPGSSGGGQALARSAAPAQRQPSSASQAANAADAFSHGGGGVAYKFAHPYAASPPTPSPVEGAGAPTQGASAGGLVSGLLGLAAAAAAVGADALAPRAAVLTTHGGEPPLLVTSQPSATLFSAPAAAAASQGAAAAAAAVQAAGGGAATAGGVAALALGGGGGAEPSSGSPWQAAAAGALRSGRGSATEPPALPGAAAAAAAAIACHPPEGAPQRPASRAPSASPRGLGASSGADSPAPLMLAQHAPHLYPSQHGGLQQQQQQHGASWRQRGGAHSTARKTVHVPRSMAAPPPRLVGAKSTRSSRGAAGAPGAGGGDPGDLLHELKAFGRRQREVIGRIRGIEQNNEQLARDNARLFVELAQVQALQAGVQAVLHTAVTEGLDAMQVLVRRGSGRRAS